MQIDILRIKGRGGFEGLGGGVGRSDSVDALLTQNFIFHGKFLKT